MALEEYAERVLAAIPDGLAVLSSELAILSANRAFLKQFGLMTETVRGRHLMEVIAAEGLKERGLEVLATGVAQHDVAFSMGAAGSDARKPVRVTLTGIHLAGEARLLLIAEDLTEEQKLREQARAQEARYEDLVQGLDAIVWEADAATFAFTFVSRRAEEILGYPVEQWTAQPDFWANLIHPEDREEAIASCRAATAQASEHELEYRAVAADGRVVWLHDVVRVACNEKGRVQRLRGIMVDITARKELEQRVQARSEELIRVHEKLWLALVEDQRLAELAARHQTEFATVAQVTQLGEMAAGLAHEINQPLAAINYTLMGTIKRAKSGNLNPMQMLNALDAAIANVHRAAEIVRRVRGLVRRHVPDKMPLQLNDVLGEVVALTRAMAAHVGVKLQLKTDARLPVVLADKVQIEQVLLNLIRNGIDAVVEADGRERKVLVRTAVLDEGTVEVSVEDSGTGMAPDIIVRMFQPFFTTKAQGMGLGLSICQTIIEEHGGTIRAESRQEGGARVYFMLPVEGRRAGGRRAGGEPIRTE